MSLASELNAALERALRGWGCDVRKVVDWTDTTRRRGGCDTCYSAEAVVDIVYIDDKGSAESYEYRGSFSELIRTLTEDEELPETTTGYAANGHKMVYRVTGREADGSLRKSQWDAWCADDCGACISGLLRPNW